MKTILTLATLALAPLTGFSETTVFSDDFSTSTFNGVSTPTTTSTSYDFLSTKTGAESIAAGHLKMALSAATTSGLVEGQARFSTTPVTLASVGDYVRLTYVFTDTANVLAGGAASSLVTGLFNTGGSAPVAGTVGVSGNAVTLNATAGSGVATGNAANWQGYVSRITGSTGSSQNYTRPLQTGAGTSSANQDLLFNGVGGGTYVNPAGVQVGGNLVSTVALTAGSQYTVDFQLTLTAAGILTISDNLYAGVDTTGTLLSSQSTATTTTLLTTAFDGLAIGVRNSGTSLNPQLDINQITVNSSIQAVPEPTTVALLGGAGVLALAFRRRRS